MSVLSSIVLHEIYDVIEMGGKTPSVKVLDQLQERFNEIPRESLYSIYSQRIRYKYGSAGRKLTDNDYCDKLYETYKKRTFESLKNNKRRLAIIPKLAEERGLFPWMTFRAILTRFLIERAGNRTSVTKKQIQQVIKNPHLIKDVQLQLEAIHCSTQDQLQGLITDSLRHIVGKDYEQILEKELKQKDIAYIDEEAQRRMGQDVTPDFRLTVPIAVNNKPVCWIDSKALFGDSKSHKSYLDTQLLSYWNRFGPGLVIYWAGYEENIERLAPEVQVANFLPNFEHPMP